MLVGELISSQVIFNQVFYDTPLNETITQPPYSNGEFIELYNIADTAVSLTGWLVRGSGKTETYSFPTNTIIPANGYLCLAYRHNSTFDFLLDSLIEVPQTNYNVLYQKKIILSNQGEGLSLYDNNGVRIDTMHYSARWAVNEDSLALEDCFSVHRTRLSYNPTNHFTFVREEWDTQFVLLGQNIPQRTWLFPENYYDFSNSAPDGTAYLTSVVPNRSTDSISVSNDDIYIHKGGSALVKTTYINPLGRTSLSLSHKSTPGGRGLATLTDYDSYTNKQYLSLPLDESIHLSKQQYEELANDYYQDSYPYFQTTNLPMRETFTNAGETYQTHPSTIEYDVNLENEVMRIETTGQFIVNTGYYSQGSLYKTTITDEDGKLNIKYTDDGGLTIIQQIGNNKTYYLYNDLKRLIAILPSPIIEYLATHNQLSYDDALMKNYAYIYNYDAKGNCVYKKQPQQEPVLMQHDNAGRLILSQDGNQRERGDIWTKTTYNDFGQIVSINETDLSSNTITQPLVENFYDNYTFLDTLQDSVKNKLAFVPKEYFSGGYANATSLLTGKKVYTIGDTTYSISAFYYDNNAQTIQQRTIGYDNTPENTFVAYNFSGTISTIYKEQDYIIETYRYEYDHSNRLTRTFYTINGEQEILLSENKYNELGQLTLKQRHNSQLNEQYEYDLRGNQTRQTNDDIDVQYYFADSIPEYATACYNSNVSAIKIKQDTTNITSIYSYDSQNRLTDASLLTNDSTCNLENFVYDEVGNILSLQRQLPLTTILIDDLNFAYVGNQITGITDFAGSQNRYDITEYQDYANEQIEMIYDKNSNLIQDLDRKICKITYNLLNLCDTIQFTNGNRIEYTYDATGKMITIKYIIKLESELYPNIDTLSQQSNSIITFTRHYRNNTEYYQTDSLTTRYRVNNQEGYTTFNQTGNQISNY
ncbi:MAG: lamin tail domain-containing protein, partial [Paludibacteraceae bacterium]|nr:lamin tail domain-containing protein [Paludibacteraceae bacterium]